MCEGGNIFEYNRTIRAGRLTLEAPQPHFTGWSPGQRERRRGAHLHGLQEPGIMGC